MFTINENYLKLPGSYLFSNIAKKINAYQSENPEAEILRLGIGDVTQPLAPAIIEALHKAVDEMANAETFHGYAPDLGYAFQRETIAKNDYEAYGCDIAADEIFVSDGAKSDSGNIQEIFSVDNRIAVCDPVTRFMWIPMLWQAAAVFTTVRQAVSTRSYICRVRLTTDSFRSSRRNM